MDGFRLAPCKTLYRPKRWRWCSPSTRRDKQADFLFVQQIPTPPRPPNRAKTTFNLTTSMKPGRNHSYEPIMQYSTIATILATISASASAVPSPVLDTCAAGGPFSGVATLNDYVDQVTHRNQPTAGSDYTDIGSGATAIFAAVAPL